MQMSNILQKAGVGRKKIVFHQNDRHADVEKKLYEIYPRLKSCGGFTLHRSIQGGYNRQLSAINTIWNDVKVLRKKSISGSGIVYIRPLQNEIDLTCARNTEVNWFMSNYFVLYLS